MANNCDFALSSCAFSGSYRRAAKIASQITAGKYSSFFSLFYFLHAMVNWSTKLHHVDYFNNIPFQQFNCGNNSILLININSRKSYRF